MEDFADFRSRLAAVNAAAGVPGPDDYTVAERDQVNALARDLDRELERYPVVHAWSTDNGSGLKFWCKYCKDHHTHGRHSGPGRFVDDNDNIVSLKVEPGLASQVRRGLRRWIRGFEQCKFNDRAPGGRGRCTCPMGSGDGHRVAHCWNREPGSYYEHGYILHEVEPNDARATRKPTRTRKP